MSAEMDASPELRRLMEQETEQLMAKETISKLTSVCWDKCVTGTPGSKFSSGEAACLRDCPRRFFDMSMILAKRFQAQ